MAFQQRAALLCLFLFLHAWNVRGGVEVTTHESVEVYLGDSAEIQCRFNFTEASAIRNFFVQWFVKDKDSGSRSRIYYGKYNTVDIAVDDDTEYSGRINVTLDQHRTQLTLQEVQLSDEREFICQVNGVSAGAEESKTHLRVFAPPDAPVIKSVQSGISITNEMPSKVATCEARNGFPKANITWYRNNMPLVPSAGRVNVWTGDTVEPNALYSVQSTLEYLVVKEDQNANFSCEVSFFVPGAIRTAESSSVGITVYYPTTMVEVWRESPKGLVKEGDTVELRCQGDGNPPPSFIFSKIEEDSVSVDLESRSNVLMLQSVTRRDGGVYRCRLRDDDIQKGDMELSVKYLDPAVVVPKESEVMLKGEDLIASCNALSNLATSTVWYKDGRMVGRGNTLHLQDATYETAGEYLCEVTVPELPSLHTSGSVHIIVHGGPQLVGDEQEVHLEEAVGRSVNLSCEARGHPAPSITWIFVGSQSWHEVFSKSSEHVTRSVVSVAVNSDISAVCNTSNDFGIDVKAFSIKAIPLVTSSAPFSPAEGSGVIIVVIILSLLLLAILGSVLYFLHKKGKIPCGRSGKQAISKEKTAKDDIVVEMKNNGNGKSEDAVLLKAVNGDKNGTSEQ
ncbi:cell surface glycoprotein MUC18 isoform X1 [Corythoichthys intestinalis]|uniref:cell surface glycoprotein MUC18 isoform X1 n=1 Tax=Corythoichthys intestinalis TaxID=161448 RepID=UPI0025A6011F|nr:cell surface glycoprotein MUC18 isoform X1 [Corythoichthys intestinalis]